MRALVLSVMALIAATYGLARYGFGLFLPQLTEEFALSSGLAGAIQAGSFLSYCAAAVLAARASGRPRAVVGAAGATAAVGALVVAAAPSAVVLAAGTVVAGAGAGFATPGLVALVHRAVAPERQESAQTVVNAGTGVGIVAAGALLALTAGHWRWAWVAIAAVAAMTTVATLRSDRPARPQDRAPHGRDDAPHAGAVRPEDTSAAPALHPGDLRVLARPLVAALLAGASSAAVWTFGRSAMAGARDGGEAYSVVAWMVLGACGVLGAGAGRLVRARSLRATWTLTTLAAAGATVVVGLAPGAPVAAYAAMGLFGAGYTALSGVLIVWAVRVLPDGAATGTVVLFVALAVGQALGAVALGALLGPRATSGTFVVASILGALSLLPVLRHAPD